MNDAGLTEPQRRVLDLVVEQQLASGLTANGLAVRETLMREFKVSREEARRVVRSLVGTHLICRGDWSQDTLLAKASGLFESRYREDAKEAARNLIDFFRYRVATGRSFERGSWSELAAWRPAIAPAGHGIYHVTLHTLEWCGGSGGFADFTFDMPRDIESVIDIDDLDGNIEKRIHVESREASEDDVQPTDALLVVEPEPTGNVEAELSSTFDSRGFHPEVVRHSRRLFAQGLPFHALSESAKAYVRAVQRTSQCTSDGTPLMLEVWSERGNLRLNEGRTETERNEQEGMKFLAAGAVLSIRNPTSHEAAADWPVAEDECLEALGLLSILFRRLDRSFVRSR
jgi:uncharacterized protein (TIGR02391 family)